WETCKRFVEDWLQERVGLKSLVKNTKANLPFWIEQAPSLPGLLHSSLQKLSHANFDQQSEQIARLEQQLAKQQKADRNRAIAVLLFVVAAIPELTHVPYLMQQIWLQGLIALLGLYFLFKKP
ncbi:MAG: ubiquinone biosynthesis regulatory protein kinase UbiB, partial [Hydrogenovibrio crunogenus]|nr:ubiquinone biosynthesis regulatory protein kinase UbiB [Hydrogenovibrio crunogenus]